MGDCSAVVHVDMLKPWVSLASKQCHAQQQDMHEAVSCYHICVSSVSCWVPDNSEYQTEFAELACIVSSPRRASQHNDMCTGLHVLLQNMLKHKVSV